MVKKVDPPNWWTGFPNPMLLISGEDLAQATVTTTTPGISVTRVQPEGTGHYLLVWLDTSNAQTGIAQFKVQAPDGSTTLTFPLHARKPSSAGFQGFNDDDVIYLIMPDRFADGDTSNDSPPQSPGTFDRGKARAYHGGDLKGITDHLPYLHDLGITTIWLNPIYDNDNQSPEDYHGYAAVDFYAVDEHFGTLKDYQELVDAAHKLGMKVLLDIVVNHCGMKHPWVDLPPEPGWLNGTRQNHTISDGAFQLIVDQHVPPEKWRNVVDGWFFNVLPDLNQNNPDMAQYLTQNALWWAEEGGVDGFRLDTFPYVPRRFWSEFHQELFHVYPQFDTVGEVFHFDPTITSFFVGGQKRYDGIDSGVPTVFDFPFFSTLREVLLHDKPAIRLEDVFRQDWLFTHPEMLVTFLGNHDTVRFMGEPGGSKETLKAAFSLLLTSRGVPQLYYGDEIGMRGGGDPDNRHDFPGGFPGDPRNAFTRQGRTADEQEIFTHVQSLLELRKHHEALRRGKQWFITGGEDHFSYARVAENDRLLMIFNNAKRDNTFSFPLAQTPLASAQHLAPMLGAAPATIVNGVVNAAVAAESVSIYEVK